MSSSDTKPPFNILNNSPGWRTVREELQKENLKDLVNHPPHYNKGIETNDYIKSWDMSYAQGNVIKYVTRYNIKHQDTHNQNQDLRKALWYLQDMIKDLEATPTVANPYTRDTSPTL